MALYPANSMFIEGYLNAKGAATSHTLQMITDAGFTIRTNQEDLAQLEEKKEEKGDVLLKELRVLRPRMESNA